MKGNALATKDYPHKDPTYIPPILEMFREIEKSGEEQDKVN